VELCVELCVVVVVVLAEEGEVGPRYSWVGTNAESALNQTV